MWTVGYLVAFDKASMRPGTIPATFTFLFETQQALYFRSPETMELDSTIGDVHSLAREREEAVLRALEAAVRCCQPHQATQHGSDRGKMIADLGASGGTRSRVGHARRAGRRSRPCRSCYGSLAGDRFPFTEHLTACAGLTGLRVLSS